MHWKEILWKVIFLRLFMKKGNFYLTGLLWKYQGKGAWYFVTINKDTAEEIKKFSLWRHGWGSIPVVVKIGNSQWKTSIFPDKNGEYVLPVKKEIRIAERLVEGCTARYLLAINE